MTSLATIIGLLPMALKLGAGSEAYAPLARAILGGSDRLGRAHRVPGPGGYVWFTARAVGRCNIRRSN